MAVAGFVQSPSEELLNSCTKKQLLKLVEHSDVDIGEKRLKEELKGVLRTALEENGVLSASLQGPSDISVKSVISPTVALILSSKKRYWEKLSIDKKWLEQCLEKVNIEVTTVPVRSD